VGNVDMGCETRDAGQVKNQRAKVGGLPHFLLFFKFCKSEEHLTQNEVLSRMGVLIFRLL
jgi:hypothetical protein